MLTMTMTLMVMWESISQTNENLIIFIFFHQVSHIFDLIDQNTPFLHLNITFWNPLSKNNPQMQFIVCDKYKFYKQVLK